MPVCKFTTVAAPTAESATATTPAKSLLEAILLHRRNRPRCEIPSFKPIGPMLDSLPSRFPDLRATTGKENIAAVAEKQPWPD
jgi:hypothetical protein